MFRRVVVLFKEGTTPGQVQEYVDTVRRFPAQVPQIRNLSRGLHIPDRDDSVAFSHVALLDFETMEDLQAFLKHPAHLAAVRGIFRQVVGKRFIVNYEL